MVLKWFAKFEPYCRGGGLMRAQVADDVGGRYWIVEHNRTARKTEVLIALVEAG